MFLVFRNLISLWFCRYGFSLIWFVVIVFLLMVVIVFFVSVMLKFEMLIWCVRFFVFVFVSVVMNVLIDMLLFGVG